MENKMTNNSDIITYTPEGRPLYMTSLSPLMDNFGNTILQLGTSVDDGNELWFYDPITKRVW